MGLNTVCLYIFIFDYVELLLYSDTHKCMCNSSLTGEACLAWVVIASAGDMLVSVAC